MIESSDVSTLSDKSIAELLTAFATGQHWNDLTTPGQIAAEIIRQHLTVRFHTFVQAQLRY